MGSRKQLFRQNLHPTKSKMAAVAFLKVFFNGYNSVATARIFTKFDGKTENEAPQGVLKSNLYPAKSKMAG